jgi:hypothetical protein
VRLGDDEYPPVSEPRADGRSPERAALHLLAGVTVVAASALSLLLIGVTLSGRG